MSDEEHKRPSSDDLIKRARERYQSQPIHPEEEAQPEPEEAPTSEEDSEVELEEIIQSIRPQQPSLTIEPPSPPEPEPEPEPEAEPARGTIPIRFEPEPVPDVVREAPTEVEETPRPRRRLPRNIGWIIFLAFILLSRCGDIVDNFFGEPAGDQLLSAMETDLRNAGLSEKSWDCIETKLRDNGYVDKLNEASVSEVEDALETYPEGSPVELIDFMEGFERYFRPFVTTSCVTGAEFESLDFTILDSA